METEMIKIPKQRYEELIIIEKNMIQDLNLKQELCAWENAGIQDMENFESQI